MTKKQKQKEANARYIAKFIEKYGMDELRRRRRNTARKNRAKNLEAYQTYQREYRRKWCAENPEKVKEIYDRYRDKKNAARDNQAEQGNP